MDVLPQPSGYIWQHVIVARSAVTIKVSCLIYDFMILFSLFEAYSLVVQKVWTSSGYHG